MKDNPKQENGIIKRLKEELKAMTKERDEWKVKYEWVVGGAKACGIEFIGEGIMRIPPDK